MQLKTNPNSREKQFVITFNIPEPSITNTFEFATKMDLLAYLKAYYLNERLNDVYSAIDYKDRFELLHAVLKPYISLSGDNKYKDPLKIMLNWSRLMVDQSEPNNFVDKKGGAIASKKTLGQMFDGALYKIDPKKLSDDEKKNITPVTEQTSSKKSGTPKPEGVDFDTLANALVGQIEKLGLEDTKYSAKLFENSTYSVSDAKDKNIKSPKPTKNNIVVDFVNNTHVLAKMMASDKIYLHDHTLVRTDGALIKFADAVNIFSKTLDAFDDDIDRNVDEVYLNLNPEQREHLAPYKERVRRAELESTAALAIFIANNKSKTDIIFKNETILIDNQSNKEQQQASFDSTIFKSHIENKINPKSIITVLIWDSNYEYFSNLAVVCKANGFKVDFYNDRISAPYRMKIMKITLNERCTYLVVSIDEHNGRYTIRSYKRAIQKVIEEIDFSKTSPDIAFFDKVVLTPDVNQKFAEIVESDAIDYKVYAMAPNTARFALYRIEDILFDNGEADSHEDYRTSLKNTLTGLLMDLTSFNRTLNKTYPVTLAKQLLLLEKDCFISTVYNMFDDKTLDDYMEKIGEIAKKMANATERIEWVELNDRLKSYIQSIKAVYLPTQLMIWDKSYQMH